MNETKKLQNECNTTVTNDPMLAAGFITKSGFKLNKKIETLDEFWQIINTERSIFARHRMYPSAFFHNWNIRLIKKWLDAGWFFQACR